MTPAESGRPAMGTPGYVWERWIMPGGHLIEIIGERPMPTTSALRARTPVIWQCTACPRTAPERVRWPATRRRAVADLVAHATNPATRGATTAQTAMPPLALPPGWAPRQRPAAEGGDAR